MRDNGLTASSYAEMGKVEPSVTDAVLDGLAEAGIAAYAESVDGGRPMDRLYVDQAAAERARAVIERSREDAEWRSLVAHYNDGQDEDVPRWPAIEDVEVRLQTDEPIRITVEEPTTPEPEEKDPYEHYVPPDPPKGPRLDWISRLAWLGLVGGPMLLVTAALLDLGGDRLTLLGALAFAIGFLTLVFRMKDRSPTDDSPDDGAVV